MNEDVFNDIVRTAEIGWKPLVEGGVNHSVMSRAPTGVWADLREYAPAMPAQIQRRTVARYESNAGPKASRSFDSSSGMMNH